MSAANIYIFPINKKLIPLVMDELVLNEAFEKAQIYSKALSSTIIQIVSAQEKPITNLQLTNMLNLSIVFAKKVKYFLALTQFKKIDQSNLLRLFSSIIYTLEETIDGNLDSENIANLLYGIYELLNEINNEILVE